MFGTAGYHGHGGSTLITEYLQFLCEGFAISPDLEREYFDFVIIHVPGHGVPQVNKINVKRELRLSSPISISPDLNYDHSSSDGGVVCYELCKPKHRGNGEVTLVVNTKEPELISVEKNHDCILCPVWNNRHQCIPSFACLGEVQDNKECGGDDEVCCRINQQNSCPDENPDFKCMDECEEPYTIKANEYFCNNNQECCKKSQPVTCPDNQVCLCRELTTYGENCYIKTSTGKRSVDCDDYTISGQTCNYGPACSGTQYCAKKKEQPSNCCDAIGLGGVCACKADPCRGDWTSVSKGNTYCEEHYSDKPYCCKYHRVSSSSSSSSGCFPAGTLILMADGTYKPIETVKSGDYVVSYDFKTGENVKAKVLEVEKPIHYHMYTLTFSDGSVLKTTNEHPIYVKNKGWSSISPEITWETHHLIVNKLEVGDKIVKVNGTVVLMNISYKEYPEGIQTYNLKTILHHHNYYADGVLVHNKW